MPDDHPVREIAAVLNLSWVHAELVPYYPQLGRPSIDPALMIRMLIMGSCSRSAAANSPKLAVLHHHRF
jgi:hypothetical protein